MSATIWLPETESESQVRETEVRDEGLGRNVNKENQEYQVKKDNRSIRESVRENEK